MNFGSYAVLAVIAVLVILAIRYAVKHRNEACGSDCSSCPYNKNCNKRIKK